MRKILIVDDDEIQLFGMQSYIHEFHGDTYRVLTATSGEDCLKLLETEQDLPDLIILDVMMPGMNGYELYKKLRMNPVLEDIPIVFLTAALDFLKNIGDNEIQSDFIEKPVDMEDLICIIQKKISVCP